MPNPNGVPTLIKHFEEVARGEVNTCSMLLLVPMVTPNSFVFDCLNFLNINSEMENGNANTGYMVG
jgi:hypothetical protein